MRIYCRWIVVPAILTMWLSGCIYEDFQKDPLVIEGYRPEYGTETMKQVALADARELRNPGKIYLYKNFLLISEINEGIHVFDNTDRRNPKPVGFIQMVGNSDMAIKDDILYADHMGNLVAVSFNDFNQITTTGELPLQNWDLGLPPPPGFYFQCVDQSKGVVIAWKKVTLKNPSCYAHF